MLPERGWLLLIGRHGAMNPAGNAATCETSYSWLTTIATFTGSRSALVLGLSSAPAPPRPVLCPPAPPRREWTPPSRRVVALSRSAPCLILPRGFLSIPPAGQWLRPL